MRIKPDFTNKVFIPEQFKPLFWDCPNNSTYMEKFIKRILDYGNFEEIQWLYNTYPHETHIITFKYPDIRRGIKFWIKLWKNNSKN